MLGAEHATMILIEEQIGLDHGKMMPPSVGGLSLKDFVSGFNQVHYTK